MAGLVSISGQVVNKASEVVPEGAKVEVKEKKRFVSRGGYKLEKALDEFNIDVKDKVALDAGTATGGFAQVLLERGAKKIIAVDVGYGQFHYKLRQDSRIELHERTNIRYLDVKKIEPVDLTVLDLSFISVTKVIDNVLAMMKKDAELIILIKPQFEAERRQVKKGVIRSASVHEQVINNVANDLSKHGLVLYGLTFSPIKGPKGNIEFLAYLKRKGRGLTAGEKQKLISNTVEKAYSVL